MTDTPAAVTDCGVARVMAEEMKDRALKWANEFRKTGKPPGCTPQLASATMCLQNASSLPHSTAVAIISHLWPFPMEHWGEICATNKTFRDMVAVFKAIGLKRLRECFRSFERAQMDAFLLGPRVSCSQAILFMRVLDHTPRDPRLGELYFASFALLPHELDKEEDDEAVKDS